MTPSCFRFFRSLAAARLPFPPIAGLVLLALSLAAASVARAQLNLDYDPDEVDASDYDTSAPNTPVTFTVASGTATHSGKLTGDGAVVKTGAGTLALTGDNTYSGATTINAGTLVAANASALGSNTGSLGLIVDGATATLLVPDGVTLNKIVRPQNGGTVDNQGTISSGLPLIGRSGVLNLTNTGTLLAAGNEAVYIENATFNYVKNTGGELTGEAGVDSNIELVRTLGEDETGWPIYITNEGGLHLTNEAGGTIVGTDYSGVYATGGSDNRVVNTGASLIQGGTGVYLDTGSVLNEAGSTIRGGETGVYLDHGWQYVSSTVTNSGAGSVIEGGTHGVYANNTGQEVSQTVVNTAGGTIRSTNEDWGEAGVYLSFSTGQWGVGTVTNDTGSLIEGRRWGVFLDGGGTVTNAGTITGALASNSQNAGIVFSLPNGYSVSEAKGTLVNRGTINGGVRFSNLPATITQTGTINGNLTLVANKVNQVTLAIGSVIDGNLTMGTSSSSSLTLNGDTGTQLFSEAVTGTFTFSTGSLTKQGAGTWVLDRAFAYTGATTVSAGTLTVNGSLAAGSTVTVAAGATLNGTGTINGNVVLRDGATLGTGLTVAGTITRRLDPLVFVPNTNSNSVSVFAGNPDGTLSALTTLSSIGSGPASVAVRGDQAFAYVTLQSDNVVKVIDTQSLAVVQSIATGTNPGGLALTPDGTRLYVANRNDATVSVFSVDAVTGELSTATTATIATGAGPRRIAFSPDGAKAYVVNQTDNNVSVIDVATSTVVATVAVGTQPADLAVSPDGARVYVTNNTGASVSAIDATDPDFAATTVTTGAGPSGVVVSPLGAHYYVARVTGSTKVIMAFNASDNSLIGSYNATSGKGPEGIAISPTGTTLYANNPANSNSSNGVVTKFSVATDTGVLSSSATTATQRVPGAPALATNGAGLLAPGATFVAHRAGALQTATGGTAVFTGGTLLVNGAGLTFDTPLTLETAGGTIDTHGYNATLSGIIAGPGMLKKSGAGTLTLSGANTFDGGTTVTGGTLKLAHANALGIGGVTVDDGAALDLGGFDLSLPSLSGNGTFTLSDGATLTVGSGNTNTTFAGAIGGTGQLIKLGTGHLVLGGTHTYTGDTTIGAGKLSLNGTLASGTLTIADDAALGGSGTLSGNVIAEPGATVAPGNSLGTLTVAGDYTWNAGAAMAFELGAASASDRLAIGGALLKNGDGAFAFDFGGTGAAGSYTLLTFGSQTGFSAANFSFTNLAANLEGSFTLSATQLTFTVTVKVEEPPPPELALVALDSLRFTYDGAPKTATATTVPAGLPVIFFYNGSGTRPTAAGTYAVHASIIHDGYYGSTTGTLVIEPAVETAPIATTATPGGRATLTAEGRGGASDVTYQWRKNGADLPLETGPSLSFDRTQPEHVGLYSVVIRSGGLATETTPVPLALAFDGKLAGSGTEVLSSVLHPNGNIYDQVLLTGKAVSVKADPGEIVRVSYVDLSDDIVQVEFSGAGILTVSLKDATGPAPAVNYRQPDVAYMKGHATIAITGADASSHLTVFSVGRLTAVNQSLFDDDVDYDGVADVSLVAIAGGGGTFGGIRTGNTSYADVAGWTGVYAPGVALDGPLFVGDLTAADTARGVLIVGAVDDARVTGGDFEQANAAPVAVDGLTTLTFAAGRDSHGRELPAQPNRARLHRAGVDVTDELAP